MFIVIIGLNRTPDIQSEAIAICTPSVTVEQNQNTQQKENKDGTERFFSLCKFKTIAKDF